MEIFYIYIIAAILFIIAIFVGEDNISTCFLSFILSVAVLIFGILASCMTDCKYSYEGHKNITSNPYGDEKHKCWIETNEGTYFLQVGKEQKASMFTS